MPNPDRKSEITIDELDLLAWAQQTQGGGTLSYETTKMILNATRRTREHNAKLKRDDRGRDDPQNDRVQGR